MAAKSACIALAIILSLASVVAQAQSSERTVGDLDHVNQETLWFEAQKKLAKARQEFSDGTRVEDRSAEGMPSVQGVQGVGNQLRAKFVYPSGAVTIAKSGDTIPGEFRISSVSIERVVLTKDGSTHVLSFSNGAAGGRDNAQALAPTRPLASQSTYSPPLSVPTPLGMGPQSAMNR